MSKDSLLASQSASLNHLLFFSHHISDLLRANRVNNLAILLDQLKSEYFNYLWINDILHQYYP